MSEWGRRDRGTFLYYVVMEREDWGHGVVGRLSLIITLHKTGTQVFNNLSFFSRSCVCVSARRMVCTLHRKGADQGPILLTREWRRGGRAGHARTRAQSQSLKSPFVAGRVSPVSDNRIFVARVWSFGWVQSNICSIELFNFDNGFVMNLQYVFGDGF